MRVRQAPQSSAPPVNINNTNNKRTGGRSHVITYWQFRKEKRKFLSEHSGSETDEEEDDGAECVCALAGQPGLGPPSCLGVDETLSVGSGQTWLLQTSLSVQQHKICNAGKILRLLYGELLTAQSGTDGKWRRFGFKVNVAANLFLRMQLLLWRQTAFKVKVPFQFVPHSRFTSDQLLCKRLNPARATNLHKPLPTSRWLLTFP